MNLIVSQIRDNFRAASRELNRQMGGWFWYSLWWGSTGAAVAVVYLPTPSPAIGLLYIFIVQLSVAAYVMRLPSIADKHIRLAAMIRIAAQHIIYSLICGFFFGFI